MMNVFARYALLLTLLPANAVAQQADFTSDSLERAFVTGGSVRLKLSAGDHTIRRGADNRIRVSWRTRTHDQLAGVKVRADVRGKQAAISASGPTNRFRVLIELPARTDLHVRMSAGELDVMGLDGNKDIELRAGELTIDVGAPDQYKVVDASVLVGEIAARPFHVTTGGLWRSFTHDGAGPFTLRARLLAGELRLATRERLDAAR